MRWIVLLVGIGLVVELISVSNVAADDRTYGLAAVPEPVPSVPVGVTHTSLWPNAARLGAKSAVANENVIFELRNFMILVCL